jgi:hypothetical protein
VHVRGGDPERRRRELISQVQSHAKEAHDLDLSDEQVLAMAEIDQA